MYKRFLTGFTLIEVAVAIFVITIGALGIFGLIQKTITFNSILSSKLTASYLAQEGIEIVRNIRDTNWLEMRSSPSLTWDDGLPLGDWQADYQANSLINNYDGRLLNIDENNFYSYSVGQSTFFKRKINITKPAGNKIVILVEVSWQERGRTNQVSAVSELYNWK